LYGVGFGEGNASLGDGAPKWATITEGLPHVRGEIWSDSYLISPAVQKAFDNFWKNAPAPDGTGVQDHYARMWKHVAERFAGNKAVIGYDIMNEPFSGSSATAIMPLIAAGYGNLYAEETGKILTENELISIFSDEKQRYEALARLKDPKKFARVFDSAREVSSLFEKGELQQMYQKVSDAIRSADTSHILFLEHSYLGNMGISSDIEKVMAKDGTPDRLVAYAGHGYDLLVDTKFYDDQSSSRVEHIFNRINETSRRLNVPVIVGEWGAMSGNSEATAMSTRFITGVFDKSGMSHTYWAYYNGIGDELYFSREMIRPYPQYTAGSLTGYGVDHDKGTFSCSWEESGLTGAPTIIFLPDEQNVRNKGISLSPGEGKFEIRSSGKGKSGYLIIPPSGKPEKRTVEFNVN
jgi:endoglycosylceramidase